MYGRVVEAFDNATRREQQSIYSNRCKAGVTSTSGEIKHACMHAVKDAGTEAPPSFPTFRPEIEVKYAT